MMMKTIPLTDCVFVQFQLPSTLTGWWQGHRCCCPGDRGQRVNRAIPDPPGALRHRYHWGDFHFYSDPQKIPGSFIFYVWT